MFYRVAETTHKVFTVRCVPVVSTAMHHLGRQTVAIRVRVHLVFHLIRLPRVAGSFQDLDTSVFAEKVMKDVRVNGELAELYELKALLCCYVLLDYMLHLFDMYYLKVIFLAT